jgi:hypothetical protein
LEQTHQIKRVIDSHVIENLIGCKILDLDHNIGAERAKLLRQAAEHLHGECFELGQGRRQPRAPRRKGL